MLRALTAEILKLRRSRAVLWTAVVVCVMPLLPVLMAMLTDGELARVTWEEFMLAGPEMLAAGWGIMLFGFAAAYLFGREYEDGTAKYLFTVPLRREYFIVAKMLVLAGWVFALTLLSVPVQAAYAAVLGLNGFAWAHVGTAFTLSLEAALLLYLTLPVVAWLSILGRGYLPPMLFSGLMTASGIVLAMGGWVRWIPWSMPIAVAGTTFQLPGTTHPGLGPESMLVAVALFAVSLAAVVFHVDRADAAD